MKKIFAVIPLVCAMAFASPLFLGDISSSSVSEGAWVNGSLGIGNTDASLSSSTTYPNYIPTGTQADPYTGVFDGKGQTITITTSGASQGLFGYTDGATIKNVKVIWTYTFTSEEPLTEIFAGGIVANASNTNIENCEVEVAWVTDTTTTNFKLTLGGIVGEAKNGTKIINCASYMNSNLKINYPNNDYITRVGGTVGMLDSSTITNCVNYGNIALTNAPESLTTIKGYAGCVAGEILGTTSAIRNTTSAGTLEVTTKIGDTKHVGGIIGHINTIPPTTGNISNIAYVDSTSTLTPYGYNETYTDSEVPNLLRLPNKNYLEQRDFFEEMSPSVTLSNVQTIFNWYALSTGWDMAKTWTLITSDDIPGMRLQAFQEFTISLANRIDNYSTGNDDSKLTTVSQTSQEKKYGESVNFVFNWRATIDKTYYMITDVLKDGESMIFSLDADEGSEQDVSVETTETGYTLIVKSSQKTAGSYSLYIEPIIFNSYLAVAYDDGESIGTPTTDSQNGTLTFSNSSQTEREMVFGQEFNISAIEKPKNKFTGWMLYYETPSETTPTISYLGKKWTLQEDASIGSQKTLSNLSFGNLFTETFLLVAVFTDDYKEVRFTFDGTQIEKLEIDGEAITSSGETLYIDNKTSTIINIYMKDGYVIDTTKLLESLKSILTTAPSDRSIVETYSSEGLYYKLTINGTNLKYEQSSINVVAELPQTAKKVNMPAIIGGSVAGGVVLIGLLFFLLWWFGIIGHRGFSMKTVREEKKESSGDDYKKYFY